MGIRERRAVPALAEFGKRDFEPFVESTCRAKPKTLFYYKNGIKNILDFESMANESLAALSSDKIALYSSTHVPSVRAAWNLSNFTLCAILV